MRNFTLVLIACALAVNANAQLYTFHNSGVFPLTLERISKPVRDLPDHPSDFTKGPYFERDNPSIEKQMPIINRDAWPIGADPARQTNYSFPQSSSATVLSNWSGLSSSSVDPSDNTIAVGPNNVVQMTNYSFSSSDLKIWDKSGNVIANNKQFSSITSQNDGGDINIIYDQQADRWVMLGLNSGYNKILIVVSQTNDPNGAYYVYSFKPTGGLPDYPKLGVWGNSYFITTNSNSPSIWALNRSAMLTGAALGTVQLFTLSKFPTIGFQSASPVSQTGTTAPPAGELEPVMRVADDAWGGTIGSDHLEIFLLSIDWTNTSNSTITGPVNLPTIAYNSNLCGYNTENCIPEPGTKKLDPLSNILMDKLQYRNLGDHEAITASHVCNADGNGTAGVRWYELRRDAGGNWYLYQQGTYQPDLTSRWMSSISMNGNGTIALGYNASSSTVYPSQSLTGRAACDPLNNMTVAEQTTAVGAAANSSNRYGDYNATVTDPVDNSFWCTANFNPTSRWATNVTHFTISNCTSPAAPVNLFAYNITANSIELSWTGLGTTTYLVRYRVTGTTTWKKAGTTSNAFSVISGLQAGTTYDLSVRAQDNSGHTYTSATITATTLSSGPERSANTIAPSAIYNASIAPIPASDNIQLSFYSQFNSEGLLQVFALNGQEIMHQKTAMSIGLNNQQLDVHALQNGSYLLKITTNESVSVQKFIIQH